MGSPPGVRSEASSKPTLFSVCKKRKNKKKNPFSGRRMIRSCFAKRLLLIDRSGAWLSLQIFSTCSHPCRGISTSSRSHGSLAGSCKSSSSGRSPLLPKSALSRCRLSSQEPDPRRNQRARPIVIDPGLYLSKKFDLFVTAQHRPLPTAFKLFTGTLQSCNLYTPPGVD